MRSGPCWVRSRSPGSFRQPPWRERSLPCVSVRNAIGLEVSGTLGTVNPCTGQGAAMAGTNCVLEESVLSDIQQTFVNDAAIYRRLVTNHKVWGPKFAKGGGGRFSTANKLAVAFLGVLVDVLKDT